jgi:hypothetical protein
LNRLAHLLEFGFPKGAAIEFVSYLFVKLRAGGGEAASPHE